MWPREQQYIAFLIIFRHMGFHGYILYHDDVIKWKHFRVAGPLCGEFTGHRWIPLTKASDAELWRFLWYAPEHKRLSKQSRRAGDLRRYRAHYDVIAMQPFLIENNETITPRGPYFQGMFRPLFWGDQDNFLNEIIWNLRWFSSIFIMNTELYDCRKTQNTLEPHSIKNTAL